MEYQERLYEADDDTVSLLRLSGMLNNICDFVKLHIEVLSHRVEVDEESHDNLQHSFEAWKRGLCPILMSYSATKWAIEDFEASRKLTE